MGRSDGSPVIGAANMTADYAARIDPGESPELKPFLSAVF